MSSDEGRHSPSRSRSITIHPIDSPPIPHRTRTLSDEQHRDNARISPTHTRSNLVDPNDPEVLERQRTMDVDLAMQMSRARRGSASIPIPGRQQSHTSSVMASSTSPLRSSPEQGFTILSPHEEEAMNTARSGGVAGEEGEIDGPAPPLGVMDEDSHESSHSNRPFNISMLPHLAQGHDPDLLFSLNHGARPELDPRDAPGALPMYQPAIYRSNFDFSLMEEFGTEEKRFLGISSPTRPRVAVLPRSLSSEAAKMAPVEPDRPALPTGLNSIESALEGAPECAEERSSSPEFARLRQRKLSQSSPTPGRRGKTNGGKLALFEGNIAGASGAPPPSLIPPSATGLFSGSGGAGPSAWGMGGSAGIHGQGHDRPYRFSFYSNALSATIHARSLSELPAEGQTFEELFAGTREEEEHSAPPAGGPPVNAAKYARGVQIPTPPQRNSRVGTPVPMADGGLGPVVEKKGRMIDGAVDDWEGNTWWLDVLSPTDDEMRMLSKARHTKEPVYPVSRV